MSKYDRAKELLRQPISYGEIMSTLREEGAPCPPGSDLKVVAFRMGLQHVKRPRSSHGQSRGPRRSTQRPHMWSPTYRRMRELVGGTTLSYRAIQSQLEQEGYPRVSLTYIRWVASELRREGAALPQRPHGSKDIPARDRVRHA